MTFTFDKLGRLTSRTEPSMVANWTWDIATNGVGKLASSSTGAGITRAYGYDNVGRLSQQSLTIDGSQFSMSTAYDSIGRRTSLIYPTGFSISFSYNGPGYLSQISNAATGAALWRGLSMTPAGYSGEDLGNGVGIETVYDGSLRVSQIAAVRDSDSSVLQNHIVSYDLGGNVSSRSESVLGAAETFSYDSLNRLAAVSGPAPKSFTYDVAGNISAKSDIGTYSYTDTAHPHAVTAAGGITYLYDANGNMTSAGSETIQWNSFNLPASLQLGASSYSWAYDADKRRSKSVSPNSSRYYFSWDDSDLFELVIGGSLVEGRNYVYVNDHPVAQYVSRSDGSSDTRYFVSDNLGSLTLTLDASGNSVQPLSYDASGKRRFSSGLDDTGGILRGIATDRGFTNHQHLDDLGLIFMKGRIYDPKMGRFLSADPHITDWTNPQNLNRYSYVLNRPLVLTDPTGLDFLDDLFSALNSLWDCIGGGGACGGANMTTQDLQNLRNGMSNGTAVRYGGTVTVTANHPTGPAFNGPPGGAGGPNPGDTSGQPGTGGGTSSGQGGRGPGKAPKPPATHKCTGDARVLHGNPRLVNHPGAYGIVKPGTAAIAPEQWNPIARPLLPRISGRLANGAPLFNGVTDVIGSNVIPQGYDNIRDWLMDQYPGALLIELPTSPDRGVTQVVITLPSSMSCPQGTSEGP